ncbi:RNA polymerase sigma factor [Crossiella sp. CA198]|uniref:RNA polymerase sigma factor n=1 Tax=Crossiella sp. CA198 TaxID=3455607 RepID=UPI003F8D81E3
MTSPLDRDTWARLYHRHARELHRYLSCRVDTQVADDLVSETFLTAWERRDSFEPARATPRAWLFGIAANLLRRHTRAEGRRLRAWAREHGRRAVTEQVDEHTAAVVDAQSMATDLAGTLAGLRPEEREVLLMVAWADLTATEIAEATSTQVTTVRTRLFRARRKLRARCLGGRSALVSGLDAAS